MSAPVGPYEPLPGQYHDVLDEDYHRLWLALNASSLKNLERSGAYCRMMQLSPPAAPPARLAAVFAFGKGVHCILGEGEGPFRDRFAPKPPGDGRTKAVKEATAQLRETGLTILPQEQFDGCLQIQDNVYSEPSEVRDLFDAKSAAEVSYVTYDEEHRLLCKVRPDAQCHDDGTVIEIKTAQDISEEGFARASFNFGYHIQRAFYMRQLNIAEPGSWRRHVYVCVANTPPYEVQGRELDAESSELGFSEVNRLMDLYSACKVTDRWLPGTGTIDSFGLPRWAFTRQRKF